MILFEGILFFGKYVSAPRIWVEASFAQREMKEVAQAASQIAAAVTGGATPTFVEQPGNGIITLPVIVAACIQMSQAVLRRRGAGVA